MEGVSSYLSKRDALPSVGQNPLFPPVRALQDLQTSVRANLGEPMQEEPAGLSTGIWGWESLLPTSSPSPS